MCDHLTMTQMAEQYSQGQNDTKHMLFISSTIFQVIVFFCMILFHDYE